MQKKYYLFIWLLTLCYFPAYAQAGRSEVAAGYGYYSIYAITNSGPNGASSGIPCITYRYYLTKNFTAGLEMSYESIRNTGTFFTIAPELTLCYLDTRERNDTRIRLYGELCYGVSVINNSSANGDNGKQEGINAYGFQATPVGIRIGRRLAFFAEIGVGYKGILHCGADLRFPAVSAHNRYNNDN